MGLQTPFNDLAASRWVGSRWFADDIRNSIITVGNASDQPTHANLTLHYNSGKDKYEYERALQPGEQIWLDVANVIRNQIPDKNGSVIPTTVQFGTYTIRDLDHVIGRTLFEGKLTIDKKFGHASYGCGNCCDYVGEHSLDPGTFSGVLGDWWQNIEWGYSSCTNDSTDLTSYVYGWGSSDSSIASVDGTGFSNAVAPGSATISAYLYTPGPTYKCPYHTIQPISYPVNINPVITSISPPRALIGTSVSVSIAGSGLSNATIDAGVGISSTITYNSSTAITATFTIGANSTAGNHAVTVTVNGQTSNAVDFFVQIPGSMSVLSVQSNGYSGYPGCFDTTQYGIKIDVKYQVLDQANPPVAIQSALMIPRESVNGSAYADMLPDAVMLTAYTDSDGTFHDSPLGSCYSSAFSASFSQSIQIEVNGLYYSVRSNSFSISGASPGHGSISNGSDISKSQ